MQETYNATANTLPSIGLLSTGWRGTRGDYHLNTPVLPALNPAVGVALPAGPLGVIGLTNDYDRNSRPRTVPAGPDIGADERGAIANQRP
jgi:hypothetical protein